MFLVTKAKSLSPKGCVFAGCTLVSLHCLRICLNESYRNALDLLSEIPHILSEVGLEESNLPNRIFQPIVTRVVRVDDGPQYGQRLICETVFSSITRTHGVVVRAQSWSREFRKLILKCVVQTSNVPQHSQINPCMAIHQSRLVDNLYMALLLAYHLCNAIV